VGLEVQSGLGYGVIEGDIAGMQHLPLNGSKDEPDCQGLDRPGSALTPAVDPIPNDGTIDMAEVDTDLMGASGFNADAQQRDFPPGLFHFPAGNGFPPLALSHRHPFAIAGMPVHERNDFTL